MSAHAMSCEDVNFSQLLSRIQLYSSTSNNHKGTSQCDMVKHELRVTSYDCEF